MNNAEKTANELWKARQDRKKAVIIAERLKDQADFYLEVINPEPDILGVAVQNLLREADGRLSSLIVPDVTGLYRKLVIKIMEEIRRAAND
jgi:hypothetical protein